MSFHVTFEGQLALCMFDHGKTNEMGSAELKELDALGETLQSKGVRVLISYARKVSSRGTPIFIAGANVTERQGWSFEEVATHVRMQRDVLARFRALPLMHIVVVDGVALGWGTEFLLTADYRIATQRASFALPETGLGIIPGAGGSSELWSLIGLSQALRLGMTGERIDAAEAARIGLVQETLGDLEEGLERARVLAALVARRSPTAVAAFKRAALASVGRGPVERREIEARAYEHCVQSGEAAVGRENFKAIRKGGDVPWGSLQVYTPED